MVAAQQESTAPQQTHAPTGKSGNCQWSSKDRSADERVDIIQTGVESDNSSQQLAAESLRYFNWDQRATARAAMQTLVMALSDDPINSYFTGSKKRQKKFVKNEVKGYLKALPRAANFIATADSKAVALWQLLPAETPQNELWAGWMRILAVSLRKWAQLIRLELHYEEAHKQVAATHGPYYYLSFIGTAPEARGRGLGSRLLQEITSRADTEGRWCLLEATSQKSEALYARHGFVTYEVFRVSKKAPPVFLMKRPPSNEAAAAALISSVQNGVALVQDKALSAARGPVCGSSTAEAAGTQLGSSFCLSTAVAAKDAMSDSSVSYAAPPSPRIAAGIIGTAFDDHLLLPPSVHTRSTSSRCSSECELAQQQQQQQQQQQPLLPPATPAMDVHVIICSPRGSSPAKDPVRALAAAAAATPTISSAAEMPAPAAAAPPPPSVVAGTEPLSSTSASHVAEESPVQTASQWGMSR